MKSRELDKLASGDNPAYRITPKTGKRCHRCHKKALNLSGCLLCSPELIKEEKRT